MSEFMELFEPAAKELYDVWTAVIEADIRKHNFQVANDSWDTLPALQKAAWLAVAVHVAEEASELLEMLITGDGFTCPLCGGDNVVSYYQPQYADNFDYIKARDEMTECAKLLIEAVASNPEIATLIAPVYQWVNERAEEFDTKANQP